MREQLVAWILVCCHDNISEIATMANKYAVGVCICLFVCLFFFVCFFCSSLCHFDYRLWEEVGMSLSSDLGHTLITVLSGSLTHVHVAAAKALGQVVKSEPSSSQQVIQTLLQEYNGLYKVSSTGLILVVAGHVTFM